MISHQKESGLPEEGLIPGPEQEMHKVSLEHHVTPESKGTKDSYNKDSTPQKPAGKQTQGTPPRLFNKR